MSFRKDLRRHLRELRDAKVLLSWTDVQGLNRAITTRCRNVCESGLSVTVPAEIAPGTYVNLRVEGVGLHGTASVRHCRRSSSGWSCGIEFSGGLRWTFSKQSQDATGPPAQETPALG